MLAWTLALTALRRNRFRSALTTLGIAIGIAAVICTVSIGEGSAEQVKLQIDGMGDNLVWIADGSRNLGGVRTGAGGAHQLIAGDATAIAAAVPGIRRCSPQLQGRTQLILGDQNWNTRYIGVLPDYLAIRRWTLEAGDTFSDADVASAARVVILGDAVARQLDEEALPIGDSVRLGQFAYTIIGVLAPRGTTAGGVNQDDVAIVPYTTAHLVLDGRPWIDDVMCSATSAAMMPIAEQGVTDLLRVRHRMGPGDPDDFVIRQPQDWINVRLATAETMTVMVGGLAAVALVVGGIGVMNIMLVSVSERTHEIGLRMAVGARSGDIGRQVLAESAMLGAIGGVSGLALGLAAAHVLSSLYGWPLLVSPQAVVAAIVTSALTGVVFGYFPARRAAALDPIAALRFEV